MKVKHPLSRLPWCRVCLKINPIACDLLLPYGVCACCSEEATKETASNSWVEVILQTIHRAERFERCTDCKRVASELDLIKDYEGQRFCPDCWGEEDPFKESAERDVYNHENWIAGCHALSLAK